MTNDPTFDEIEAALREAGASDVEIMMLGPEIFRAAMPRTHCRIVGLFDTPKPDPPAPLPPTTHLRYRRPQ